MSKCFRQIGSSLHPPTLNGLVPRAHFCVVFTRNSVSKFPIVTTPYREEERSFCKTRNQLIPLAMRGEVRLVYVTRFSAGTTEERAAKS